MHGCAHTSITFTLEQTNFHINSSENNRLSLMNRDHVTLFPEVWQRWMVRLREQGKRWHPYHSISLQCCIDFHSVSWHNLWGAAARCAPCPITPTVSLCPPRLCAPYTLGFPFTYRFVVLCLLPKFDSLPLPQALYFLWDVCADSLSACSSHPHPDTTSYG